MDIALSLRTMVFLTGARFDTLYLYKDDTKRKQWVAYLQVGAGGFELCSHPVFVTPPQRAGFPLVFTVIESYLASSGLKNNLFLKEIPPLYKHTLLVWMFGFGKFNISCLMF
ncbi:putative thymidylate synthase (FAD) [Helianthus annuus]|nr:putative thymidylate synthase (FAD) [Helianthus annuus]KAJ0540937.1 putative thymidylate synthase (FAD) [Helianthus annuus]KAJ0886458.1 putative thymidylate synthase (FAD) [Helianthus annuus]